MNGYWVVEPFLGFWRARGGLEIFGLPISGMYAENGMNIQWFERARFEQHPHGVQLGRVGAELRDKLGERL